MTATRVLIVDDSAFARKVLREVVGGVADFEIVGIARDGLDALEKIVALAPDVVTLDLMMPSLDGVGVMRALAELGHPARVVLVSTSEGDSEMVVESLALGAVALVHKPTALATDRLFELADDLVAQIRIAATATRRAGAAPSVAEPEATAGLGGLPRRTDLLVLGTSTGGPQALTHLVRDLPADLPAPLAIALHIPEDYTAPLASRLDREASLAVVEASDGQRLEAGTVYIARGGQHLLVERDAAGLFARLATEPRTLYVPSVDILFTSAARAVGSRLLGVVMTGMGDDGLAGARAIVAAGGRVLTEAESSAVVYGMPRCVQEADLSAEQAPLQRMADAIRRHL